MKNFVWVWVWFFFSERFEQELSGLDRDYLLRIIVRRVAIVLQRLMKRVDYAFCCTRRLGNFM